MELSRIRPVLEKDGPFLTVHVEVGRGTEDAPQQLDARWTTLRHELEHAEMPPALVDDIGDRVRENTHAPGEARRTIVAAGGTVVFDEVQIGHSFWPEFTETADLPDLAGWLTMADADLPFVVVVADREGADVEVYRALTLPATGHETVHGDTLHIRKVPQGDWAHKRYQQGTENTWHRNAEQVTDTVRGLAAHHRPRAIMVAGDVRARADIASMLESPDAPVVPVESGGRAEGASTDAMWEEIQVALAQLKAADDQTVVDRLTEGRGRGDGAATGLDEVVDALVQARVERLVLDLGAAKEKSIRPRRHEGLPLPPTAAEADELPADRALVAAAALSGADLSVLPAELSGGGGVAALLRWTQ
jgi:hypothetical protein